MAKLPKSERDAICNEVRAGRTPFRPTSQNAFMEPNLEQIYRDEASAGKLVPRGHIAHKICSPLEYDIHKTEGI